MTDGSPIISIQVNQDPTGAYFYGMSVNGLISVGNNGDGYPNDPSLNYPTAPK